MYDLALIAIMATWQPKTIIDPEQLAKDHAQEYIMSEDFKKWISLAVGGTGGAILIKSLRG